MNVGGKLGSLPTIKEYHRHVVRAAGHPRGAGPVRPGARRARNGRHHGFEQVAIPIKGL